MTELRTQWQISGDDETKVGELKNAQDVFDEGRELMLVVAACKVLYEMKGKQQLDNAGSLLDKKRSLLKDSLVAALEKKIASNGPSAK